MREARQPTDATGRSTPPNFLAILSLGLAIPMSPLAIILGLIALRQIARTGERGRAAALLAVTVGTTFTVATLVVYVGIAVGSRGA